MDLVEKQAAIDAVEFGITFAKVIDKSTGDVKELFQEGNRSLTEAIKRIKNLPTAEPERKRGKWVEDDDGWNGMIWRCSECDALFTLNDGTPEENEYYFCPHCGADMRGE